MYIRLLAAIEIGMMRLLLLLLIIILECGSKSNAQILDIYRIVPDDKHGTDMSSREVSISNFKSGIKSKDFVSYHLDTVDETHNYLKMSRFTAGILVMRSWNMGGKQLVAVYEEVCDPMCGIAQFNFFIVNGKSIERQNIEDVIPGFGTIYEDFEIKSKMTTELIEKFKNNEIIAYLLFKLPRTGNDITVLFGNEDTKETYAKFSKGNRMRLKWTNGKFVKEKIYWD